MVKTLLFMKISKHNAINYVIKRIEPKYLIDV